MRISFLTSMGLYLSSMITHLYLSFRSYALKADVSSESTLCQIGKNWDCDTALTSSFSEFFSFPISNFGFALNTLCFFILILIFLNWVESRKIWSFWVLVISLGLALGSIVMFFISLIVLKKFCTLCTLCYIFSFAVLWPVKNLLLPIIKPWNKELSHYARSFVWIVSLTFGLVFFVQAIGQDHYNIRNLSRLSQSNFSDWKTTPPSSQLSEDKSFLSIGPSRQNATFTIVEFADFLCPYCGRMYFALKNFVKLHPQVRIEYMFFPLDPKGCQLSDMQETNIISTQCILARATYCAEEQRQGLSLQDFIYTNQNWFLLNRERTDVENKVNEFLQNINQEQFQTCLKSAGATIAEHRKLGQELKLTGTPTLYINRKKIQPVALGMTLNLILNSQ